MTGNKSGRDMNMNLYYPLIAAVQQGARQAKDILKTSSIPVSTGISRLGKLRAAGILSLKKDGYVVNKGYELSEEQIAQLSVRASDSGAMTEHPELRRIEQRLMGCIDELRALAPLIVSPRERVALEALRKSGVTIR